MEFEIISVGICYASVCTSLSPDQAAERLNAASPTGISTIWRVSDDNPEGPPNGCTCPDQAGNKHWLMNC